MATLGGGEVGIALLDGDGRVLHRSDAFEALLGAPVPNGERLARCAGWLRELVPTRAGRYTHGALQLAVEPARLSEAAAVVYVTRAPSEGTLARDLRIARATLKSLLDAAPVSILVLDLEQRVTLWNAAAERTFGWTAEEVVGGPYPLVPEEERAHFEKLFCRVMGGEGFTGVEAARVRRDGRAIHLRIHTAPMRDADGRVVGAMALLEDLTRQRRLEAQVRQSERLEALGRLAGGVAHDFNNLLTVILGIAEMLERSAPGADRFADGVRQIRECGEHARGLTGQLLAFSRRQVLHPEVADMSERVRDTAGLLGRLIGDEIEMSLDLAPEPLAIRVDTSQFDQMLVNLVVNARDAMSEGGHLHVATSRAQAASARKAGLRVGAYARLDVSDDGPGIPEEILPHIFDPFYTTKLPGRGTGLGLATVHGVVEQSGGAIRVESSIGRGTTFRVWLPLSEGAPERTARPVPATEHPRGHEAVLLVEDDDQVRAVGARMLGMLGYQVHTATDGRDALRQLESGLEVDLLITDLSMPRMGGWELAGHVRRSWPSLAVMLVSANLDDEELRAAVDGGRVSFLQKPFTLAGLARALRARLD